MTEFQTTLREDQDLPVFGETVIIRRDPGAGQPLDAAVIEEIVPPGVGAPRRQRPSGALGSPPHVQTVISLAEPPQRSTGLGGAPEPPTTP